MPCLHGALLVLLDLQSVATQQPLQEQTQASHIPIVARHERWLAVVERTLRTFAVVTVAKMKNSAANICTQSAL